MKSFLSPWSKGTKFLYLFTVRKRGHSMNIGGWEYLIIFLIILLLFGAKKIPDLARGLGQGIQEFRKASDEVKREIEQGKKDAEEAASATSSTSNDEKTTSSS